MDDDGGLESGVRLVVTAILSAAVTATLVIAIGQTMIDRPPAAATHVQTLMVHTSS